MTRPILIASTAPCVHCGSGRNHLVCHGNALRDGTPEKLVYQVTCAKCRASGPVAQSADEAAEGWATRAQPVLLSGLDFEEENAAETAA
jgi:hypothetical protein